jgi:hypothetical protein
MLWLSGEPVGPYWRAMGVTVLEMPHVLEVEGQKGWVLPRGLDVETQKVCVLPHGLGGAMDRKS